MAILRPRRGSPAIEFVALWAILAAMLVTMGIYMRRGLSGKWRQAGDTFGFGRQYEPINPGTQPTDPGDPPVPPPDATCPQAQAVCKGNAACLKCAACCCNRTAFQYICYVDCVNGKGTCG